MGPRRNLFVACRSNLYHLDCEISDLLHSIHNFPNTNSLKDMVSILEQLYIQEMSILEKASYCQHEIADQVSDEDENTSTLKLAVDIQSKSTSALSYSDCYSMGLVKEVEIQCDTAAAAIRAYKENIAALECAIEFEKRNNEMENEDASKRDQEFLQKIAELEKELDVGEYITNCLG